MIHVIYTLLVSCSCRQVMYTQKLATKVLNQEVLKDTDTFKQKVLKHKEAEVNSMQKLESPLKASSSGYPDVKSLIADHARTWEDYHAMEHEWDEKTCSW